MKVLFVISAFGTASGAEQVLLDYLKTESRIEPKFLLIGPGSKVLHLFAQITDSKNIFSVKVSNSIMSPISRFLLFRIYRHALCKAIMACDIYKKLDGARDFDVVYYNNSFESMTFYTLFPGAKKIIHIHDMIDMFRPAQKECIVTVCKKAKQIIAVSNACGKMISNTGIGSKKITVAHNAIDIEPQPWICQRSDILTIGFVGSAIRRKGFDLFVRIVNRIDALLKQQQHKAKRIKAIIITNSDKSSAYLKKCIQKLNKDIDIVVNYSVPREKVFALYKEMNLLLVPSRFDPLPTVVLESYLAGTPVFGTAKDGMLEMQVEQRMMFALEDTHGAVKKILDWLAQPQEMQREIVLNTQKFIQSEFTVENKRERVYSALQRIKDME